MGSKCTGWDLGRRKGQAEERFQRRGGGGRSGQQARDRAARDEQRGVGQQPDAEEGMNARKKQQKSSDQVCLKPACLNVVSSKLLNSQQRRDSHKQIRLLL